jgi:hypothetical protein
MSTDHGTHVRVELAHDLLVLLGCLNDVRGPVDEMDGELLGLACEADLSLPREPERAISKNGVSIEFSRTNQET